MQQGANEAFSQILLDKALEFSGWNLLDSQQEQVRFELNTVSQAISRTRLDALFQSMLHRTFNGEI